MELSKIEKQQLVAHLTENVCAAHTITASAKNGVISPSLKILDYSIDGVPKSLLLDWRSQEQMQVGKFSYSQEYLDSAKDYEMVVIVNEATPTDNLRWFPNQVEGDPRFTKTYLEDDDEAVYTIDFSFDNPDYQKRYEQKT